MALPATLRPPTCVIIEDEPLTLNALAGYCAQVPFLALQGPFYGALVAFAFLQAHPADLVLPDRRMSNLSGLLLAQWLLYLLLHTVHGRLPTLQSFK